MLKATSRKGCQPAGALLIGQAALQASLKHIFERLAQHQNSATSWGSSRSAFPPFPRIAQLWKCSVACARAPLSVVTSHHISMWPTHPPPSTGSQDRRDRVRDVPHTEEQGVPLVPASSRAHGGCEPLDGGRPVKVVWSTQRVLSIA